MKLCVLQSAPEGCAYEDNDSPADVQQHVDRSGLAVTVENVMLSPGDFSQQLVQLASRFKQGDFDCVVNLCDGAWDEPSPGIEVVDLLQNKLNLPFTGADMTFFEPTRLQMKKAALACGIKVPLWRFVYSATELENLLTEYTLEGGGESSPLKFPLLVKHFSSYSSVGLIKDSKVWNASQLRIQCERMLESFGGCLIEEFIEGREFTVLAAQVPSGDGVSVMAYDPVECCFAQGEDFKHYNLKWVDFEEISWLPVTDNYLSQRLKKMAVDVFQGIRGRGYGRIDVRSDPTGETLYFLEINPNCGVFYPEGLYGSADFILDRTDRTKEHATFLMNQVEVAMRLWRRKQEQTSVYEARYNAKKESWGMFALKDLEVGEVIQENEETPLHVVSKAHVLRNWRNVPGRLERYDGTEIMNSWENFVSYCWPISDNLFVMWDPSPDKWSPINHSCDPNAWNEQGNGLNVVARRPIKAGEEIRLDYATFVGYFPDMKAFECDCGSSICRGMVTGLDIIKHSDLARRYDGHMTDYVTSTAKEAHGSPITVTDTISFENT